MISVDATIIIVNWNGGALLKECLQSLAAQTVIPREILVFDNGSSDGSIELVENLPGISVQRLACNFGFAFANNQAVMECKTKHIVLLNPDAIAESQWLENLIRAADEHPEVSIFGSRQIMLSNKSLIDGLGDRYHFSGLVRRDGFGMPVQNYNSDKKPIFSACACAVLYRREAFEAVHGFDEDYFCYVEDVDLGFRMRLAGYKAMSVPTAIVYHAGSASSGGHRSDFSIYHGHRNLVWTYIKNMPTYLFWILLPMHIALNVYSIYYFSLHGKRKVIWRAKWDAIKGIPKMWQKRSLIQAQRQVSAAEIWSLLDKRLNLVRK
ncbi:MAG: glycosyltransferase family 2 protein [Ferruginibacter sp.]|nr:glycosyltransferase family 2 protein [Ferruginibacter sp.]